MELFPGNVEPFPGNVESFPGIQETFPGIHLLFQESFPGIVCAYNPPGPKLLHGCGAIYAEDRLMVIVAVAAPLDGYEP